MYPKKLSHKRKSDTSAAAASAAPAVHTAGFVPASMSNGAAAVPPTRAVTSSKVVLARVGKARGPAASTPVIKSVRAAISPISKGTSPGHKSEPRSAEGDTPTRNSHAQKSPKPKKRIGTGFASPASPPRMRIDPSHAQGRR